MDTIDSSTSAAPQHTPSNSSSRTKGNHFIIAQCRRETENAEIVDKMQQNAESSDDSDSEEKILVVYFRAGKLGAAYYTLQTGELFILQEIVDRGPEFQMFLNLFRQVDPVSILLDSKNNGTFLFILQEIIDRGPEFQMFLNLFRQVDPVSILLDGKNNGTFVQLVKKTVFDTDVKGGGSCKLVFLSAREYSFEACKRRILSLSLPSEPPSCSEDQRAMFLRTALDFSQVQTVHALGALLRYLDMNWTNLSMDMQGKSQFLSLRTISLADIVTIDDDTYRGLQIFSSVAHPSGFKKGVQGTNKEGLSLFQTFSKCCSKVGQSKMRVFLQHPTRDLSTLKRRQDVVAFFLRPQNDYILKNICSSLRFIKNVNGILAKIKALSAKAYQWKSLYNTLYNAVLISEICENAGNSGEILEEIATYDNNKLYEMALYMNRIIDFDLTKSEGKFTVKAGVDPDLDIKKQTMASLHTLMSETAKVEMSRLPDFIEECSMLYMPHLGYLLGVKAWAEHLTMEEKELPDMKFMFQNNDYIHYKSKGCEELDVMIGDTYPETVAHETRIMMRLTAIVLDNLHTLAGIIDKCAELDCLIAISKVCKEHNYVRPLLTDDKIINIKQGQHPLYIINNDNFVPNDVDSSTGAGYMKILTGPNSSGKSVYIKMVGLIVYLAHIGSFVPCESATIGVVEAIHSRIHSTECVAGHMSAFLIDLRQLSVCVSGGARSLVLCDEAGAGCGRRAGGALLAAVCNTLLYRGEHCPHAMFATHYLDVYRMLVQTPLLQYLCFEYIIEDGSPVFLYRLREGRAEMSLAHSVAEANGLAPKVVDRARKIFEHIKNNTLPPADTRILTKLSRRTESIIYM